MPTASRVRKSTATTASDNAARLALVPERHTVRLLSLKLDNFRAARELSLAFPEGSAVLAGRNAVGRLGAERKGLRTAAAGGEVMDNQLDNGPAGISDGPLIDAQSVAKMLDVSVTWVYAHTGRRKPTMPHLRMGSSLRFRRESVVRWLKDWEIIGDRR